MSLAAPFEIAGEIAEVAGAESSVATDLGVESSQTVARGFFENAQNQAGRAIQKGMQIGETVGKGVDRIFKVATIADIGYRAFKDVIGDDDEHTTHLPSTPTDPNKPPPITGPDQPNIYVVYGDQAKQQWGNIPKYPHEPKKYGRRGKRSKTHHSKKSN